MVKSFSVEWLAQSHHRVSTIAPPEDHAAPRSKPHMPCLVQPRPPTSYSKVCLQPKARLCKMDLLSERVENPVQEGCDATANVLENHDDSSGYESEANSSEGLFPEEEEEEEEAEGEAGAQRRIRTKFTADQIHKLEKTFNKHKYLGATERMKMAAKLHLSETQVKTWFQNRRMKLKREVQDMRAEYLSPGLLPRLALPASAWVQHHSLPGQHLPPARFSPALAALYPPLMPHIPGTQMLVLPSQLDPLFASQYY
ncbi:homeobox protein vent1-like [Amia ocellicauda]|uniref:homeobox protein vent1-like n=1 Tax=Amia ocellicauda TaxID=2972642 RepID=UPI0034642BB5